MINYFNSPFLYWEPCDKHKELKDIILPKIEDDYKLNKNNYRDNNIWNCKCTSSFHSKSDEDFIKRVIGDETLFTNSVFLVYNNMLQTLYDDGSISDYDFDIFQDAYIEDIWYNYYEVGENQDIHEHTPNTFSGIYLLDLNDEVNNTVWYNGSSNFPCDGRSTFDSTVSELYNINEGHIIIFPSRLPHFVPPTKNKKITISFNIRTHE